MILRCEWAPSRRPSYFTAEVWRVGRPADLKSQTGPNRATHDPVAFEDVALEWPGEAIRRRRLLEPGVLLRELNRCQRFRVCETASLKQICYDRYALAWMPASKPSMLRAQAMLMR